MTGTRIGKKDVARIDADWLLGESSNRQARDFFWFPRILIFLICIASVVWSWPYASRQWLKWEWHQQLANSSEKQTEDVLPILLALNDLNPTSSEATIEQLASTDERKRSLAFHLLEKRIKHWSEASAPSSSEIAAVISAMSSPQIRTPESMLLRGELASQMRNLIPSDSPDALRLHAALNAMIVKAEPDPSSKPAMKATVTASFADNAVVQSPASVTRFRLSHNDSASGELAPMASTRKPTDDQRKITESEHLLTSMRTQTDQASAHMAIQLPNLNISIPRTVPKAVVVQTPSVLVEPLDAPVAAIGNAIFKTQEATAMVGIEKLELEKLLPLLTSSQPKIEQQAFNELLRRGMTTSQLETAIALAKGDVEQRMVAMELIARNPDFDAIPWLVWMAENADRSVRRRAVVLLGSMTDPAAMRKLRILQAREPDSAIADQINQVLLAFRTASISVQ